MTMSHRVLHKKLMKLCHGGSGGGHDRDQEQLPLSGGRGGNPKCDLNGTRGSVRRAVEASGIEEEVNGGKVRLENMVQAWHERAIVGQAAWTAYGFSAAGDNLRVA